MPLMFYPHSEDLEASSTLEKLALLMDAAERYKAVVLETAPKPSEESGKRRSTPRDIAACYNWDEISKVLQGIRNMPEASSASKATKANHLIKLAEVYEVLRGAKMPKLEAVRIALMNEANQLKAGSSQVA